MPRVVVPLLPPRLTRSKGSMQRSLTDQGLEIFLGNSMRLHAPLRWNSWDQTSNPRPCGLISIKLPARGFDRTRSRFLRWYISSASASRPSLRHGGACRFAGHLA